MKDVKDRLQTAFASSTLLQECIPVRTTSGCIYVHLKMYHCITHIHVTVLREIVAIMFCS